MKDLTAKTSKIMWLEAELKEHKRLKEKVTPTPCTIPTTILKSKLPPLPLSRFQSLAPFSYTNTTFEQSLGECEYRPLFEYEDGSVYVGQWKSETKIREGRGTYINKEGWIYEGYWFEDEAHEYGRNVYADGGVFLGGWLKNMRHGHGVHKYSDGRAYSGQCANGFFEGIGVMSYPDGSR